MVERNTWLALTPEEVIEPELPICDPHHHLWDLPQSRYLVDEFLDEFKDGHRVVKTVYVECLQRYRKEGPDALRPVGETEFVESIAATSEAISGTTSVAVGITGFADLTLGPAVQPVLEAHLEASPRFRGIRHASAWDASDKVHNSHTRPSRDMLESSAFREGFACLRHLGLSFDAWLYHPQIPDLISLARAFPDVPIILDHIGGPLGIGPYADKREEVFSLWRKHIIELSRCSNVNIKLGGLSLTGNGFGWHKRDAPPGSKELAETLEPYYQICIENFGAERCMFESNYPVDSSSCSYTVLWNAFKRITRNYTIKDRSTLFHDTAVRVYKLDD